MEGESFVEIKIGVQNSGREIVLESNDKPEDVTKQAQEAIAAGSVLSLTDEKGRLVLVPTSALAYLEIGAEEHRRIGFGVIS